MAHFHVNSGKRGRSEGVEISVERRLTESKRGAGLHNIERDFEIVVHF